MREIKFRAYDYDRKVMVGTDYPKNWGDETDETWGDTTQIDLLGIEEIAKKKRFAVMQYTGLKDKNRKEIYEGDIVRSAGFENARASVIEWHVEADDGGEYSSYSTGFYLTRHSEEMEVIGNIYENPKLLK